MGMKNNKLVLTLILIPLVLFSFYFFNATMILGIIMVSYLLFALKDRNKKEMIIFCIAFIIASLTVLLAHDYYHYTSKIAMIFPLFPLFAWTCGLIGFYYILSYIDKVSKIKNPYLQVIVNFLVYIVIMLMMEYLGYNHLGIRLDSDYPGLPFCNCLHSPLWMQTLYFLNGLIFIISIKLFVSKNHNNQ